MEERDPQHALLQLAGQVAGQLVARALAGMLRGAAEGAPVTITVCNAPEPLLLPAHPRRGRRRRLRKPGQEKAGWSAARRRKFMATVTAKGFKVRKGRPRATPSVKAGACFRCDHPAAEHLDAGACEHKGCTCQELYS